MARQAAYRQMFEEELDADLVEVLRDATQRRWVPARDAFRREIEAARGRRVNPPVRGRPRKSEGAAAGDEK